MPNTDSRGLIANPSCFRYTLYLLWLSSLLLANSSWGQEKQILWIINDWPPIFILENGQTPTTPQQLGNGTVDRTMAEIISRMPGYQHTFLQANTPRTWAQFAAGKNQCYVGALKNAEHEKITYFTPALLVTSVSLVVREDVSAPATLQAPLISLAQLMAGHKDLHGYVDKERSYGAAIDQVLATAGDDVRRVVVPRPGHLLRLLDAGRMDYTLEYPTVVEYQRQQAPFAHTLKVIPLSDAPLLSIANVACTRNQWGKEVIRDVAVAVQGAANSPAYRNAIRHWLPSSLATRYSSQMNTFYDNLAHKPSIPK